MTGEFWVPGFRVQSSEFKGSCIQLVTLNRQLSTLNSEP